jgi:hypothetical protein
MELSGTPQLQFHVVVFRLKTNDYLEGKCVCVSTKLV